MTESNREEQKDDHSREPYDASVAHTSRNDAVNTIRNIIREAGGDLNDYNIEAIADEVLMNVTWPRARSVEDVTCALAHTEGVPLKWDVNVSQVCGAVGIVVTTAKGRDVRVQRGKSVDFYADGRVCRYDAPTYHDMVTLHEDRRVGTVYDTDLLDDLRDLADRVHIVEVHLDHILVDGDVYSGYILMDEDGGLTDLPYGDPEVYADAMGLRLEVLPMGE